VEIPESGYRFTVPHPWVTFGEETRSPSGSIFTIEIKSLVDADPTFLAELPDSILPQIEARTRYYFTVVEPMVRSDAAIDGRKAALVVYPVRVRPEDAQQEVRYWIVLEGDALFLLRATLTPPQIDSDRADAQKMIESFRFVQPPAPPAGG